MLSCPFLWQANGGAPVQDEPAAGIVPQVFGRSQDSSTYQQLQQAPLHTRQSTGLRQSGKQLWFMRYFNIERAPPQGICVLLPHIEGMRAAGVLLVLEVPCWADPGCYDEGHLYRG